MKRIGFSGTLDPITNGHMWVIGEARALADEVVVLISENPAKAPQFPADARKRIVEESLAAVGWDNVSVIVVRGDYTARAAKRLGIDYLIRGIRNTSDFDYENLIQQVNVDVLGGAKTIFVMPPRDLGSVSSSFVRGLQGPVGWHWSTSQFMPAPAYQAWILDWLRREWDALWDRQRGPQTDRYFDVLTGPQGYGAPGRAYHNLDHLVHGLTEIRVWAVNTAAPDADRDLLKKAFWFHDAVQGQPGAGVNEEQSAQMWIASQLGGDGTDDVAALIRATAHGQMAAGAHRLADVMVGADLAILGQPREVYQHYAHNVRLEYDHVPQPAYRAGRDHVLRHFLALAHIFRAPYFADLYEQEARANLEDEVGALSESAQALTPAAKNADRFA